MHWFIKHSELGRLTGCFLGLGFWEDSEPKMEPIPFGSKEEAEAYLKSWVGWKDEYQVPFLSKYEVVEE